MALIHPFERSSSGRAFGDFRARLDETLLKKWLTNPVYIDIIFCVTLEVDYAFAT